MNFFLRMWTYIKNIVMADWVRDSLERILKTIILPLLSQITFEMKKDLEKWVIYASNQTDLNGKQKLQFVINKFRETYTASKIGNSVLNFIIEYILQEMKRKRFVN